MVKASDQAIAELAEEMDRCRRDPVHFCRRWLGIDRTPASSGVDNDCRRARAADRRHASRVAMRMSQAAGCPSPRNVPSARYASTNASWVASSASSIRPNTR